VLGGTVTAAPRPRSSERLFRQNLGQNEVHLAGVDTKRLIYLALPRGLEPLFSP
jgi:hypothetical protein